MQGSSHLFSWEYALLDLILEFESASKKPIHLFSDLFIKYLFYKKYRTNLSLILALTLTCWPTGSPSLCPSGRPNLEKKAFACDPIVKTKLHTWVSNIYRNIFVSWDTSVTFTNGSVTVLLGSGPSVRGVVRILRLTYWNFFRLGFSPVSKVLERIWSENKGWNCRWPLTLRF